MATVHAPKSITEQEAEGWAGSHTVHDVFPLPQLPLTRARLHAVLSILHTVTQSCMPPAWDNQNCLFPELAPAEMVQSHCTKFLVQHEKLAQDARRDLADDKRILTKDKEVAVMRGLGSVGGLRVRPNNPLHNFVELIYQGDTEHVMHKYVQDVKKRMMAGATKREHFYVKLYVGCRDWDQATVWAKGMTLLAAKAYLTAILKAHDTLGDESHPIVINSMAHSPALTARQARRSGVEEGELRARWGV